MIAGAGQPPGPHATAGVGAQAPVPRSAPDWRTTVVIATRDRAGELRATLQRLRDLPERPPVVVVDNASSDGTVEQVRAGFPWVDVVDLAENRGAAARNAGALHATTPYVALSDDDSWWAAGALRRAADHLDRHPSLGLVAARILVGPDERLDPTCAEMAAAPLGRDPGLPGPAVLGFLACGAVVRRGAFLATGGFEPRLFIGGEEELLAMDLAAAGWELVYADDVIAHHHPSQRRDGDGRRRLLARNALWVTWLRRPAPTAAARTLRTAGAALRDPGARGGLVDALGGLGWVRRERRRLPPAVEEAVASLERL